MSVFCVFSRSTDSVISPAMVPSHRFERLHAQALGAALLPLSPAAVDSVVSCSLTLLSRPEWEVRHSALLGLKYILAAKSELAVDLLPAALPRRPRGSPIRTTTFEAPQLNRCYRRPSTCRRTLSSMNSCRRCGVCSTNSMTYLRARFRS